MQTRLIGEPLRLVGVSAVGHGHYNGRHYIYAVSSGHPCVMFVIDVESGSCVKRLEMQGSSHTWGVSVTSDGTVYAGGDGVLYRYVPGTDTIENLGVAVEGETYFWLTTVGDDDRPYVGTYPGGKVFRYEPDRGVFRSYGQMAEGEQYVRSIAAARGKIYAGTGTSAHLVELDPETGEKRELAIPEECAGESFIYGLRIVENRLFAHIAGTLHVMDLDREEWIGSIKKAGAIVSAPDENGHVYLVVENRLHAMDLETLELTSTEHTCGTVNNMAWTEYKTNEFSGKSLISGTSGGFWVYNPATGKSVTVKVELTGQPVGLQSLAKGKNGTVYIGGYFLGGFATYNVAADQLSDCKAFGQTENMLEYRGKLYLGVYTGARIYQYDPDLPWDMGQNPKLLFGLKDDYNQDRPFAFTSTDQYVAIGTVPEYGALGGVLVLYDPDSNQKEVFPQIVRDQSVICLTSRGPYVFGGTSVSGGLGVKPTEKEAKLFMFDTVTKDKVWEGVPIPGERAVSALCVDDEGDVWGLTPSAIFRFDPETKTVDFTEQWQSPPDYDNITHYWRSEFIQYDAATQSFYGNFRGKLFKYGKHNRTFEALEEEINLFTRDEFGNLYFARGTKLYQVVL